MLRTLKDLVARVRTAVRNHLRIMGEFDKTERELDKNLRRRHTHRRR
jgi:hypothetical protein